jgi:hypothetical protein
MRRYKEMDLVTLIKTLRMKWLGHVNRMIIDSQRGHSWGWEKERKIEKEVAG